VGVAVLRIEAEALCVAEAEARRTYPEECCGLLLGRAGDGLVTEAHPTRNWKRKLRARRFSIWMKDYLRIDREGRSRGLSVLGLFHSHPNHPPEPSAFDAQYARNWPGVAFVIIAVWEGGKTRAASWVWDEEREAFVPQGIEVLGRPGLK